MTPDDIRRLPAGAELDDLVAEKVLGQCLHRDGFGLVDTHRITFDRAYVCKTPGCGEGRCLPPGVHTWIDFGRPTFSLDASRAIGQVVHVMRDRGYCYSLEVEGRARDYPPLARFIRGHHHRTDAVDPEREFYAFGDGAGVGEGAALATCRAALLAVWPSPGRSRSEPWWGPRKKPAGGLRVFDSLFTLLEPGAPPWALPVEPVGGFLIQSFCPWCYDVVPCEDRCHLRVQDPTKVVVGDGFMLVSPDAFIVERRD